MGYHILYNRRPFYDYYRKKCNKRSLERRYNDRKSFSSGRPQPQLEQDFIRLQKKQNKAELCLKTVLDRVSGVKNHQGIVAYATDFKYSSMDDILSNEKKKLILILDGIEDPHNLGSIIRTADAAGADGIIIPKHRSCGVTNIVIKVSSGAAAHVKIAKVTNINDAIRSLKELGIWIYARIWMEELYQADLKWMALIIGGEERA